MLFCGRVDPLILWPTLPSTFTSRSCQVTPTCLCLIPARALASFVVDKYILKSNGSPCSPVVPLSRSFSVDFECGIWVPMDSCRPNCLNSSSAFSMSTPDLVSGRGESGNGLRVLVEWKPCADWMDWSRISVDGGFLVKEFSDWPFIDPKQSPGE
jgi:hypothetical protein